MGLGVGCTHVLCLILLDRYVGGEFGSQNLALFQIGEGRVRVFSMYQAIQESLSLVEPRLRSSFCHQVVLASEQEVIAGREKEKQRRIYGNTSSHLGRNKDKASKEAGMMW